MCQSQVESDGLLGSSSLRLANFYVGQQNILILQ